MVTKPMKYKEMEQYMTITLCADTALFIFYLVTAGFGVIWLKVILALLCLGVSGMLLWFLYTTHELLRQRSLWITTGAAAIVICLFFSLILNFPSPNKYKHQPDKNAEETTDIAEDIES